MGLMLLLGTRGIVSMSNSLTGRVGGIPFRDGQLGAVCSYLSPARPEE